MYRSLLVPVDGSPFAEQALPLALSIARRTGAALEVAMVHVPLVHGDHPMAFDATIDRQVWEEERAYLENLTERLTATGVPIRSAFLEGSVAEVLNEHVLAGNTDTVVLSTHGRGPLSRFWLGSVADALVRRLPRPILMVRPHEQAPANLTQDVLPRHILVPLDGTVMAEHILEPAVALGSLAGADYTLLQVVVPVPIAGYHPGGYAVGGIDLPLVEELQKRAQNYLQGVAERLLAQALKVTVQVVVHPQPAVAVLEQAKVHGTDLIAVETHGRRGLSRMVLGSVADKVLRGATLPVLIQRPAK